MEKSGVEVKVLRIRKGMGQRELAEKVGVTVGTICKLEHGKCNSISLFKKVADALEVDYHTII